MNRESLALLITLLLVLYTQSVPPKVKVYLCSSAKYTKQLLWDRLTLPSTLMEISISNRPIIN